MTKLSERERIIRMYSRQGRPDNPNFDKKMEELGERLGLKKVPFPKDGALVIIPMELPEEQEQPHQSKEKSPK